jgi:CHASE3 domain sensor protein
MFLKPLSPSARLLVWFGLTAPSLLVTVACVFTFQDLDRMNRAFGWVRHALQAENRVHRLVLDVHEFEDSQRGYLFTGRASHRLAFSAAEARVPLDVGALSDVIDNDPVQKQRLSELQALVMNRLESAHQAVDLKKAGHHDAAHKLARLNLG